MHAERDIVFTNSQWRIQDFMVGRMNSPSLLLSFPLPQSSLSCPSLPSLLFHPILSLSSPEIRLVGLGERLSSPSSVRGGVPAANAFLRYFEARKRNTLPGTNFRLFSSTKEVKVESN